MITQIVSGGQTGVDRAALDVALECGMACGGWCPKDRQAEDGPIPARYPLHETPEAGYAQRTEWNVRDSDGTLVLTQGQPTGGTAMTVAIAARLGKPCLILDRDTQPSVDQVKAWVAQHHIRVLNVAGPRESTIPGMYAWAVGLLRDVFSSCGGEAT